MEAPDNTESPTFDQATNGARHRNGTPIQTLTCSSRAQLGRGDPVYAQYRQSQEWTAGSVTKRTDGHLYDTMLAHGSTRRFHANQMQPRSKQTTDDFTAFQDAFNLPVCCPQVPNTKTGDMGKHAVVHNQQTSNQGTPAEDKSKLVHSSKMSPEPCRSKRGLNPKNQWVGSKKENVQVSIRWYQWQALFPWWGVSLKRGAVGAPDYNTSMANGCSWMSI